LVRKAPGRKQELRLAGKKAAWLQVNPNGKSEYMGSSVHLRRFDLVVVAAKRNAIRCRSAFLIVISPRRSCGTKLVVSDVSSPL